MALLLSSIEYLRNKLCQLYVKCLEKQKRRNALQPLMSQVSPGHHGRTAASRGTRRGPIVLRNTDAEILSAALSNACPITQVMRVIPFYPRRASQVAQMVKNPPAQQEMQETRVQSLGQEDPLEKEMATHSSTLAWEIPRTEEPGGCSPWGRTGLSSRTTLLFRERKAGLLL